MPGRYGREFFLRTGACFGDRAQIRPLLRDLEVGPARQPHGIIPALCRPADVGMVSTSPGMTTAHPQPVPQQALGFELTVGSYYLDLFALTRTPAWLMISS